MFAKIWDISCMIIIGFCAITFGVGAFVPPALVFAAIETFIKIGFNWPAFIGLIIGLYSSAVILYMAFFYKGT